ncbi:DNA starvation/stationary phase protection protein [Bacillus sp. Bva_UNVM-123]|uniref:Dps family protein n=1 Tax=Bacillus sp. Bva_UNVM-123 TaxID=2829798 RepID=UPI00391F6010
MEKLHAALNVQVANWSVLYTKLHNYHWFVKGPFFFTLHEKFEELYNEAADVVDEVAEKLLANGGTPIATMKEFLNVATIEEENGKLNANDMVSSLLADYKKLQAELKALAELADDEDNDSINDLAVGLVAKLDLHIWMLTSYLGE